MNRFVIVQPATTERNLGGVCYMPYWHYAMMRQKNEPVSLYENVTMRDWDELLARHGKDRLLIDLSSYPQIDFVWSVLPDLIRAGVEFSFIGYEPLIRALGLPFFAVKNEDLLLGVFGYLHYFEEYRYGLLSDCDNHLKHLEDGRRVVPLFLSVGCKRGCPYCYVAGSNYPYGTATERQIEGLLDLCVRQNWNIHFTDENFFAHPLYQRIVERLRGTGLRWICLTDTLSLHRVLVEHGAGWLQEGGNALNEVGLEVLDSDVLAKEQAIEPLLARRHEVPIFWLTMTFLPHDTLGSMRATGEFLRRYGYRREELLPRIQTNSTVGGLGQFMQLYHGTVYWRQREKLGRIFTERPTRLWPSFIGHRLLASRVRISGALQKEDEEWLGLYVGQKRVEETLREVDGRKTFGEIAGEDMAKAVALAQAARLGLIEEGTG
jgi:hypothetical protein